jgi:hydroxymethylbilane synthase
VPIAAHALWEASENAAGTLALAAYVGSIDGVRSVRGAQARPADDPEGLGVLLAAELLERGAGGILDEIRTP